MNPTQVTVIAILKAKPGLESVLRDLLTSFVAPTRLEAGCLNYDLHETIDAPGAFTFHENWRSQADLDRHIQAPHIAVGLPKAVGMLVEPPQIIFARRIA